MRTKIILINKRAKLRSESSKIAYQISLVNKRIRECKSPKLRKELLGIQWKLRSSRAKVGAAISKLTKEIGDLVFTTRKPKGKSIIKAKR